MFGKRCLFAGSLALALLALLSPLPTSASHRLLTLYGTQLAPTKQFNFMSGTVDPAITFTRAGTTASQYNSAGTLVTGVAANIPREDYNPTTLGLNGLLIEQASTNNSGYSNDFSQSSVWRPNNSPTITANTLPSPDGTSDASQIVSAAGTAVGVFQIIGATNGVIYDQSIYLKKISGASTNLIIGNNQFNRWIVVNPQTMTITSNASSVIQSSVQNAQNGWYRVQYTYLSNQSGALFVVYNNDPSNSLTLGVYGASQEPASLATSPIIPTTTASVTRNIDSAIIPNPSWFNASGGTLFVQIVVPAINTSRNTTLASFNDGTANNQIKIILNTAGVPEAQIIVAGTAKTSGGSLPAVSPGSVIQAAVSYQSGGNGFAVNGMMDSAGTLATATLPSGISQLTIGDDGAGAQTLDGWEQAVKYWNSPKLPAQVTRVDADVIDALLSGDRTNRITNLNLN